MTEQRTKEWFEQRRGKITGSVSGSALGMNKYLSPAKLLRRMVREFHGADNEFSGNISTEYGALHEPMAMLAYSQETGNAIHEIGFIVAQEHEWLGASPDGLVFDVNGPVVLEIKCPFGMRNDENPVFKTAQEQPHYYAQMQIEMFCAQASLCHFYQWSEKGSKLEVVPANQHWLRENIPKLKDFYDLFLSEINNPEHLGPVLPEIDGVKESLLLDEYDQVCAVIDSASARKKEILETLVLRCDSRPSLVCGRKLSLINRPGAISYAKAFKDLMPDADLSKYIGKPTEYWKLG